MDEPWFTRPLYPTCQETLRRGSLAQLSKYSLQLGTQDMELLPKQEYNNDDVSDLPALPSLVRMKDGQLVDTASNIWQVRSPKRGTYHTIDWNRLEGPGKRPALSVRARQ